MKAHILKSILLCFVFIFAFACEDSNPTDFKKENADLNHFEGVLNVTSNSQNAKARKAGDTYYFKGKMEFWNNTPEKEFSIYINDNETVHIIILQETDFNKELKDGSYELTWYPFGVLLVNNDTNEKYFLGIKSNDSEILLAQLHENGLTGEVSDLTGAGLIHNSGPQAGYKTMSSIKRQFNSLVKYLSGGSSGGGCDSGGAGATVCSTTSGNYSCSVSCSSGYYACCNNPGLMSNGSCDCIKVK